MKKIYSIQEALKDLRSPEKDLRESNEGGFYIVSYLDPYYAKQGMPEERIYYTELNPTKMTKNPQEAYRFTDADDCDYIADEFAELVGLEEDENELSRDYYENEQDFLNSLEN